LRRRGHGSRGGRLGLPVGRRARAVGVVDDRELSPDRDRLVLGDRDAAQDTRSGGGYLGVHLVGGDLEQRFVRLYALALLLEPARDGALGDALAELGHGYRDRHGFSRLLRCSALAGAGGGVVLTPPPGQAWTCRGFPASAR